MSEPDFEDQGDPEPLIIFEETVIVTDWIWNADAPDGNSEKATMRIRWTMDAFGTLTPNEWLLFDAYRADLSQSQIAVLFGIEESEVSTRRDRMLRKFGVETVDQMLIHYWRTPKVKKLRPQE